MFKFATILTNQGSSNSVLVNKLPVDSHDVGDLKSEREASLLTCDIAVNVLWYMLKSRFFEIGFKFIKILPLNRGLEHHLCLSVHWLLLLRVEGLVVNKRLHASNRLSIRLVETVEIDLG